MIGFHHIGVQTADIDETVRWYSQFFCGGSVNWTLEEFSELTRSRLPGISRLVEFQVGTLRIHIYDRSGVDGNEHPPVQSFQHCGLTVPSAADLEDYRGRWHEIARGGTFPAARWREPSDVVVDADGVGSLYVEDVNGLEFELTYVPEGSGR